MARMKLETKLTKGSIKDHFSYSLWKYVVAAVLAFFAVDMFYIQTAYHPPEHLRIDVYVRSATATQDSVNAFLEPVWKSTVPEMETVESVVMLPLGENDYMAQVQLLTYLAAHQGDIYMLSAADFKQFAAQGAFIPLETLVAEGEIDTDGIDVTKGYVTLVGSDEAGNDVLMGSHLFGIPTDSLAGFTSCGIDNGNMFLSITQSNENDENVIPFFSALIEAAKPADDSIVSEEAAK